MNWCVDFNELTSTNDQVRDLRPLYVFWFDNVKDKFKLKYVMSKEDMFALSVRRFYTRFLGNGKAGQNTDFYAKLISNEQFTKEFFHEMKNVIPLNPASTDVNANKQLYYEQYSWGKRDTDTVSNTPSRTLKEPKPRADRCVSAYNPTTKELVVQFMPVLEDRHPIYRDLSNAPKWQDDGNSYQIWFSQKMKELETYLSYKLNPLPGCKRRVFALHLESDELKSDPGSILNWTKR